MLSTAKAELGTLYLHAKEAIYLNQILVKMGQLWECVTAGCKAFSLTNGKGMGTNDWVIKSLDD
jgi:hypothetical protein